MRPHTISALGLALLLVFTAPALAVVHVDQAAPARMYDGLISRTASTTPQAEVDATTPASAHQMASLRTRGPASLPGGGMAGDRHDLFPGTVGTMSPNMIIQIGVGRNSYPGGGDDLPNYFGVFEGAIDDYGDPYDVADPGAPPHCLNLIFRGDQYGDNPSYPENGLAWDIREPFDFPLKIWKIEVVLPDEGYTYDLYYDYDPIGYPLPDGWCCFVDMDGEINGGNYMNLDLYELRLTHQTGYVLTDLVQTGGSETWYVLVGHCHMSRAYVDCHAPGPYHDGLTWDTAFLTIEQGIRAVDPDSQVWVADGTYVENIVMRQGVAIYGGFLGAEPGGYETELDQRDFENNVTTIDGNQSGSCVTMAVDARVDGFTITNGSGTFDEASGRWCGGGFYCSGLSQAAIISNNTITGNSAAVQEYNGRGGGIYCESSSPTLAKNIVTDNVVTWAGGGIYCRNSSPAMTGNTVRDNQAYAQGGGISCEGNSSATVINNEITDNYSINGGGGIYCDSSSPSLANNIIAGNSGDAIGGGIGCYASAPVVVNNLIVANKSCERGGGISCTGSSPMVTNNVIAGNLAQWYGHGCGGGIWCGWSSSPTLTNNIVTDNAADFGGGVWSSGDSTPVFSHNDFWENSPEDYYGCEPGPGDISADPSLADPEGGDFHLSPGSPCIDAGDNNAPGLPEYDFEGDPRIIDGDYDGDAVVDIGADELLPMTLPLALVDLNAPGPAHNGLTWDTAFLTIQQGVDAATPGGEVWVADGTYVENVVMGEGVAMYGGFLGAEEGGYETERDQRDFVNNVTVIEGNMSGRCVAMTFDTVVDGFTITRGAGGVSCAGLGKGAVIANNIITDNLVEYADGAGIYCTDSSPSITGNTIIGNTSVPYYGNGAGIYCGGDTSAYIADNKIIGNRTGWMFGSGGGVYCSGTATVTRNLIAGNVASSNGGGVFCGGSSVVTHNVIVGNVTDVYDDWMGGGGVCCADLATVACNLIVGNSAMGEEYPVPNGGGVYCVWGSPTVTSNTISGNTAYLGYGGGICNSVLSESPALVANNIVTGNGATWWGGGICCRGVPLTLSHNDVWANSPDDYAGCEPGEGDISADPLFIHPESGNYHLSFGSPCIDTGTNYAPGLPETDWDAEERIVNGIVDIGADEFLTWTATAPDPQPECDGPLFGEPESGFPGWVWFSIPMTPAHSADPNDVLGFICNGVLWRWDKYGKCYESYSPPFFDWELSVGDSYMLGLLTAVTNPSYEGLSPFIPWTFEFKLGRQGWTWVGMPGLTELSGEDFMSSVKVKYPSDDAGACRTAGQDYGAIPDNWIAWGWPYWNTWRQGAETFTPYAPFGHSTCYPWVGYRCWVNVGTAVDEDDPDQVTLIWPKP